MKYENPSIALLGSASNLVQRTVDSKFLPTYIDNLVEGDPRPTDGSAYESDE